jgi:hypothetical protein
MAQSELRQRKPASAAAGDKKSPSVMGDKTEKYVESISSMAPAQLKPYITQAIPYVRIAAEYVEAAIPILEKIRLFLLDMWVIAKPYKPELLLPAFIGFVMCFFGGSFVTLIAAAEAYKMCCHESLMKAIADLSGEIKNVSDSNKEDDTTDKDNNGIPDSLECTPQELMMRKTTLFFKTVDPKVVTNALTQLNSAGLAIVATLKLQFVKTITLGTSISTMICEGPAKTYIVPTVKVCVYIYIYVYVYICVCIYINLCMYRAYFEGLHT